MEDKWEEKNNRSTKKLSYLTQASQKKAENTSDNQSRQKDFPVQRISCLHSRLDEKVSAPLA